MAQIFTTALTTQNISSSLLVKTWTVAADYDEVLTRIFLSGLAGNGTYQACATIQVGGTGTVYQSPTSTGFCAATVTTLWLPS